MWYFGECVYCQSTQKVLNIKSWLVGLVYDRELVYCKSYRSSRNLLKNHHTLNYGSKRFLKFSPPFIFPSLLILRSALLHFCCIRFSSSLLKVRPQETHTVSTLTLRLQETASMCYVIIMCISITSIYHSFPLSGRGIVNDSCFSGKMPMPEFGFHCPSSVGFT